MNKVFQANNTIVPCREFFFFFQNPTKQKARPLQHMHKMPNGIIFPHTTPEWPVLHLQVLQVFSPFPPSEVRLQTLHIGLFP